ncbi:MKLN1 [Symbiodinium necroappetens]|uniref:MKLN1 protein n=1 Tax=Symbiodinium necroappetens TaxID=1628268 RepID=A0A813BMM2_9DINO|nr:MKLN1 [Symbiodinium necroappetens]
MNNAPKGIISEDQMVPIEQVVAEFGDQRGIEIGDAKAFALISTTTMPEAGFRAKLSTRLKGKAEKIDVEKRLLPSLVGRNSLMLAVPAEPFGLQLGLCAVIQRRGHHALASTEIVDNIDLRTMVCKRLAACVAVLSIPMVGAGRWIEHNYSTPPLQLGGAYDHAMVYDNISQALWVSHAEDNKLLKYDVQAGVWSAAAAPAAPPNTGSPHGAPMAYDSIHQALWLFAGGDLWRLDLLDLQESQVQPGRVGGKMQSGTKPSERLNAAMVYDSINQVLWLHGGYGYWTFSSLDDFWKFDIQVGEWAEQSLTPKPSARRSHAMAYDGLNQVLWLYGGYSRRGYGTLDDLWKFKIEVSEWVELQNLTTKPPGLYGHAMAYDSTSQVLWLHGGRSSSSSGSFSSDLWAFENGTWSLQNLVTKPDARDIHAMAYDSNSQALWLHGGSTIIDKSSRSLGDFWKFEVTCPVGFLTVPNAECDPCPVGTWTNVSDRCFPCSSDWPGSTTQSEGSSNVDMCVRPLGGEQWQCTSGVDCHVGIQGYSLQGRHRLAVAVLGNCGTGAFLSRAGMSHESPDGSDYTWTNFMPEGGTYQVCWCANMHGHDCAHADDFRIAAGWMEVKGPLTEQTFSCVRGADCHNLQPLNGTGLLHSLVAVRSAGCWSRKGQQISPSNKKGIANVTQAGSNGTILYYVFTFGVSSVQHSIDNGLTLTADDAGHDLCWCGMDSCSDEDFFVPLGKLRVEGPLSNQETSCAVGQPCSLSAVQAVGISPDDRIMVLNSCANGVAVQGFPGGGLAMPVDGAFQFMASDSEVLHSRAGIYRLCFCRQTDGSPCNATEHFSAAVGLLSARGPFHTDAVCELGTACMVELSGLGLQADDRVVLTRDNCDDVGSQYDGLEVLQPIPVVQNGSAFHADLGKIPLEATPGDLRLCWCGAGYSCDSVTAFRAEAANLAITCPKGYFHSAGRCTECGRGFYCSGGSIELAIRKPCPANSDSDLRATSETDCKCMRDFNAIVDGKSGSLDRCADCRFYEGLICPGGFDEGERRDHAQPRAEPGFFQTGNSSAVRCMIEFQAKESVCLGSNECVEGSSGRLCGECAEGWARGNYLEPCESCHAGNVKGSVWLALVILTDVARIAVLNFGVAALSAQSAGTVSLKLHSPMIRILLRWRDACSVLTGINLDGLPAFPWSRATAHAAGGCSGAECARLRFDRPPDVTHAIDMLFSAMRILPSVNVEFAASCQAQAWFPGNTVAHRLGPALYYLFLPVMTLGGTICVCAIVVYVLIPMGNKHGLVFNKADHEKQKHLQLARHMVTNVQEAHEDGDLKFMWRVQEMSDGLLLAADWGASVEVMTAGIPLFELESAAKGTLFEQTLRRMVLGAVAWKLRGHVDVQAAVAEVEGLELTDIDIEVATALALSAESSQQLKTAIQEGANDRAFVRRAVQEHKERKSRQDTVASDASKLDFGLFSRFPSLEQLLLQTRPVVWLTQLALWPELVSKFLQLIRCSPMPEDKDDGTAGYVQRLLPHPDIECWTEDHAALIGVAVVGLSLWCLGIPLLLFMRIWMLTDRQDPDQYRLYGFFIQGLAPRYWYWDLIVKRADIALMLLVAYTSIANDDNAKLLLFPLISGMQLGISAWISPYANSQSQILDVLEFVLLISRFVLFSVVAILLIFFPSVEIIWAWAMLLLVGIFCTIAYASVHILAQFLRSAAGAANEMEDRIGEDTGPEHRPHMQIAVSKSTAQAKLAGTLQSLWKTAVRLLLPFVEPPQRLVYRWSLDAESPVENIRTSQIQPSGIQGACPTVSCQSGANTKTPTFQIGTQIRREALHMGVTWGADCWHGVGLVLMGLFLIEVHEGVCDMAVEGWIMVQILKVSNAVLRFDLDIQREDVNSAYKEFLTMWWCKCSGKKIPSFNVLCLLAITQRALPNEIASSKLYECWEKELEDATATKDSVRNVYADDFTNAVNLFGALPIIEARRLLDLAASVLRRPHQNPAVHSDRLSSSPRSLASLSKKDPVEVCTAFTAQKSLPLSSDFRKKISA